MLQSVDDDEKLIQTLLVSGQNRDCWFLTEDEKLTTNIIGSDGHAHNQSFLTEDGLYLAQLLQKMQ